MLRRWPLRQAARVLHAGGLVAYPTEAVYGLGCDPWNAAAVMRLLDLKQRPADKGLILIGADYAHLEPLLQPLEADWRRRLARTWPGPVTWVIPAAPGVPPWLRGRHDTLAVRLTAHPVAAALCRAAGQAIVSTSANRAGHPPATTPLGVRKQLDGGIDILLGGPVDRSRRPTEIRDIRTGRVLRPA